MPDQLAAPVRSDLSPTNFLSAGYEDIELPAVVLLDNVRSVYNVGAFFRAADGVSLEKLFLCGITAHPPKKAIAKTALGAEGVVPWEHDWDAVRVALELRNRGYEVAAIETSPNSLDLFQWQPKFPVCVAFGHEVEGLRPELLQIANARTHPHAWQKDLAECRDCGRSCSLRTAAQMSCTDPSRLSSTRHE